MGVGVELRAGGPHAAHPGGGCDAARPALRPGRAAADAGARQHRVDPLVPGVEQMPDVDGRLRRPEPEPLVRLVPDQPVAHPGIAAGGGGREAAEVARPRRGVVRRATAVRPRRRPDEREHWRQAVATKPAQNAVRPAPVVGAVARRGRVLRPPRRDLVPAQREADERHAEPLERHQPLIERPRAELQPRVVLDPVLDARRSLTGARGDAGRKRDRAANPSGGRPHRRVELNGRAAEIRITRRRVRPTRPSSAATSSGSNRSLAFTRGPGMGTLHAWTRRSSCSPSRSRACRRGPSSGRREGRRGRPRAPARLVLHGP